MLGGVTGEGYEHVPHTHHWEHSAADRLRPVSCTEVIRRLRRRVYELEIAAALCTCGPAERGYPRVGQIISAAESTENVVLNRR